MEGRRVHAGSDTTLLLPTKKLPCSSEILHSFWNFNSSPSLQVDSVSGSTSMFNFENSSGENVFYTPDEEEDGGEDYDRCSHRSTKKRRLRMDQVQFLERSFEVDNKLEPKRKVHLAKELGLQPQQVAIWFQNRRARYKTKQLEKDYDSLKASYDKLKADNDSLLKENEKLEQEVHLIREKLILRERGKEKSPCDPINSLDDAEPQKPIPKTISQDVSNVPMVVCKQEDANSAKSDVFDSESTHYTDGNSSSLIEPANSSHVFEPEQSDFTHDEEDNLSRSFLTPPCFPKVEEGCYDDPDENSCNLGYPIEDQSFWFWP